MTPRWRAAALLVAAAAALTTHWLAFGWFVVVTCGVSDVARSVPAEASAQGWVCARRADSFLAVPGVWLLLGSTVVSVVLAAVLLRRRAARWWAAAGAAVLAAPLVSSAVLAVPPDTCSPEERRSRPAYDCSTRGNG